MLNKKIASLIEDMINKVCEENGLIGIDETRLEIRVGLREKGTLDKVGSFGRYLTLQVDPIYLEDNSGKPWGHGDIYDVDPTCYEGTIPLTIGFVLFDNTRQL